MLVSSRFASMSVPAIWASVRLTLIHGEMVNSRINLPKELTQKTSAMEPVSANSLVAGPMLLKSIKYSWGVGRSLASWSENRTRRTRALSIHGFSWVPWKLHIAVNGIASRSRWSLVTLCVVMGIWSGCRFFVSPSFLALPYPALTPKETRLPSSFFE